MLLLVLACDRRAADDDSVGPDDSAGEPTLACAPDDLYADTDRDGYLDWGDCACLDATIHPDAEELANDDDDPTRNPGADEVSGDGLDLN